MNPHEKCDIVVVDGGHGYHHAWGDLESLREMATPEHVLLVDDTNMGPVGEAWEDYKKAGKAVEDGEVLSRFSEAFASPFTVELEWGGSWYREEPHGIIEEWASSLSYGRFV